MGEVPGLEERCDDRIFSNDFNRRRPGLISAFLPGNGRWDPVTCPNRNVPKIEVHPHRSASVRNEVYQERCTQREKAPGLSCSNGGGEGGRACEPGTDEGVTCDAGLISWSSKVSTFSLFAATSFGGGCRG